MISGGGVGGTAEEICKLIMNGEETLGMSDRFKPLHDPLSPSGRLVAVLGAIVQALMLPMFHAWHDNSLCGGVTG